MEVERVKKCPSRVRRELPLDRSSEVPRFANVPNEVKVRVYTCVAESLHVRVIYLRRAGEVSYLNRA
jgi:IS30 family transposase